MTGRGVVYTVKINKGACIRMGDVLSDLRGNRFEVSGIEMCRRKRPEGKTPEDMPLGLMFKQLDGMEVFGNILVSDLEDINFIFVIIRCIKEKLMKMSIKRLGYNTLVHNFQHIIQKYNNTYKVQMPVITPHVCRHTIAQIWQNPE